MFDWPIVVWFLQLFEQPKTGHIVEDPEKLGYFWEEDDE